MIVGTGWAIFTFRPVDTSLYWYADLADLYGKVWTLDAPWVYPPPLAVAIAPLHTLGWPLFVALWTVAMFFALWVATREWFIPVILTSVIGMAVPAVYILGSPLLYAMIGNIQSVIAAAIVLGFRWPAAWAFVLLTKIGPGVGILWFAFRREWRDLGIAVGATCAIAAVTYVLAPDAWSDFVRFALSNATTTPPVLVVPVAWPVRVAMSVALLWWGARTDRRWTVPIAAGWSAIALYQESIISLWVAGLVLARSPSRG